MPHMWVRRRGTVRVKIHGTRNGCVLKLNLNIADRVGYWVLL